MIPNFNKLVQKDGKSFLKDEAAVAMRLHQVSELQGVLDDAVKFLKDGDFPGKAEDVYNVLDHGRDGLLTVVWSRADQEAKRLNCRPYVAQTWREQERESVTHEQWSQADALRNRYARIVDGLPFDRLTDITDEDGLLLVDTMSIAKRIEHGAEIEITEEMQKMLGVILELASKVEAVEVCGINALELIGKIIQAKERPSDVELYRHIVFRRHQPGTVHDPGTDWLMNQVALGNSRYNPLNK